MAALKPPKGYKRGLSDQTCFDVAERALASPLGQQALRQGWGRGLFRFVMAWGSTPTKPETKADMRAIRNPNPLQAANLRLYEARARAEEELKRKYLRSDADG